MTALHVSFRGERVEVVIDHDGGWEPDTNAHVIEWHFAGMTPEQQEELELTDAEEEAIELELVHREPDDEVGEYDGIDEGRDGGVFPDGFDT